MLLCHLWRARSLLHHIPMDRERMISYLPLSHIAGLLVDIFVGIAANNTVHFADKGALKGTLLNTLRDVRPTMFGGVPRVWEKFHEGDGFTVELK